MATAKIDGHVATAAAMLRGHVAATAGRSKSHENRVRRMAGRQGLRLSRSRRRDFRAYDYGVYTLSGANGPLLRSTDLAEIEAALSDAYGVRAHWYSHINALGFTRPGSVFPAAATAPREHIKCEHRFTDGNFEIWECRPGEPWTITKRGWRAQGVMSPGDNLS